MFYTDDIRTKRILLHACCGPCSLGAIEPLVSDGGDITLFYYNPCIIDGEFDRRLTALQTVAEHYGLPLIVPNHDHAAYLRYASALSAEREGGARCTLCFADRLRASAEYAARHGFDAFTTTLTVSPHKDCKRIFAIADELADEYRTPFLPRDFKKRNGFSRSCVLSRELGIYRQNFCGCEFSLGADMGGDYELGAKA